MMEPEQQTENADCVENADDEEIVEMKKRVEEMESEQEKLNTIQRKVEREINSATDSLDEASVYVGQVDYEASPEELKAHFSPCGTVNRVTIICDKYTKQPKGFAYVEFVDKSSICNALKLDGTTFKGRQIKVLPKRQNMPTARSGPGRSRSSFSRVRGNYGGNFRGRRGRFRGRGR